MTIVVAYADTPPGRAALNLAAQEALHRKTSLIAVPAVSGTSLTESQLTDRLGAAGAEIVAAGGTVSVGSSELHDPADAVIQVAQQVDATLICLGLRHRSPVGKLLLGSTAQRILLDATCPVLSVKAD